MKVILLLLVAATAVLARQVPDVNELSAYGYLTKFGIPEAERIRQGEEEYLKNANTRIVGGSPSALGQFPYQAGLVIDIIGSSGVGVCGASVLTNNRLVTAAHCWFDGSNQAWRFTVVLGSLTLFTGGTRIETQQVLLHPQWQPQLIRNDVAIISLPNPVTFNDIIAPIALPSGNELSQTFAGATGTASGYGLTVSPGGSLTSSQFLSHVDLNIITNQVCSLAFPGIVQPSNLCISTLGGASTCQGDSGGPLVVQSNGRPILVGITSFGSAIACAIGLPSAFVRVTSFVDFINSNL